MSTSKTFLGAVHHISEDSIFFLPTPHSTLDLKTLSTAPPCHRAVLQRNGLVAKVYAALTVTKDAMQNSTHPTRGNGEGPALHQEAQSLSGRQDMWRSALTYAGLLSDKDATINIPRSLASTPWPYITPLRYASVVQQAAARAGCVAVNSSSYCVPILSMQEYVYKRHDAQLSLLVLWMPCYPHSVRQWAAAAESAGKRIPEASLLALLHHMTLAQLTVRSGDTIAGRAETTAASLPTLDSILVHQNDIERDGRSGEWGDAPLFVLSASTQRDRLFYGAADVHEAELEPCALMETPADPLPSLAIYCSPEERTPRLYPTHVSGSTKRAVWAMGMVLYLLATGRVSAQTVHEKAPPPGEPKGTRSTPTSCSPRRARMVEEAPLNAASMTPDALWKRLRRDLERRGYSSTFTTVAAQLLSLDPLTRPSLTTLDRMLQDLHRPTPILRFPFVVGDYDLLRFPNPGTSVVVNPGARRYTFAEVCVLCKKPRGSTAVCPKGGDHQAAGITSPSWNDDGELLPSVQAASDSIYMTYLYPLCGASSARQRRKQAAHALQNANASMSVMASANVSCNATQEMVPLHCGFLLQVFGGFAVYERRQESNAKGQLRYTATVREVLIPYPSQGVRRSEASLVSGTLHFGGALPWPSWCTETLQRGGRVSRHVPFALVGAHTDVEWFGWVLPGERFAMPNGGHWTAPLDGAFVFWFGTDLQPTDRDRYFAVTSARAATLPTRVPRTHLPDSLFRQHVGEENQASTLLMRSSVSGASHSELQPGQSVRSSAVSAARRRSTQSVTDICLPAATREIVEEDEVRLSGGEKEEGEARPGRGGDVAETPRSTRRRRSSATRPRRSLSCQVSVVAASNNNNNTVFANGRRASAVSAHQNTSTKSEQKGPREQRRKSAAPLPPLLSEGAVSPDPVPLKIRTQNGAAAERHGGAVTNATGSSPANSNDAACGPTSSRESTQSPSHRDTSAKNVRALAPLSVNETKALSSSREPTNKRTKQWKSRVMVAADAPRAAQQPNVDVIKRIASPIPTDARTVPSDVATPIISAVPPQSRSSKLTLSPRPARRPTSSQSSRLSSARQQQRPASGLGTPTFTTPTTMPLSKTVSALASLHICGAWQPADVVDAVFQALTFWILSTGEHGHMSAPLRLSTQMSYAIRAPPGAVYLSFLSNEAPLFRRNHPRMDVALFSQMLPHHGFACYGADGKLLGVLALRCSLREDADVAHGEFVVHTRVKNAYQGSQISGRLVYASYLTGSVGDEKAMLREKSGGEAERLQHLRHSPSFTQAGVDSRLLGRSPSEAQTLTFTSARRLIGEFTPHDKESDEFAPAADATAAAAAATLLPSCWMGFDGGSGSLLVSDAAQSVWVPYSIGV